MTKRIRPEQLTKIGSDAIEKSLTNRVLPGRDIAVVSGFDGNVEIVEYVRVGKRPEDGVLLARARVDRTTGEVISVETFV
jgi:hypothetical protein